MSDDKAVVFLDKSAVKIPFKNYSSPGKTEAASMSEEEIYGFLIVFNSYDGILCPNGTITDISKKIIEGLASEISVAYVNGWKVIYFTTFKKFAKSTSENLPREFTVSEDDLFFNETDKNKMIQKIHSYLPFLKVIRFIGILSEDEKNRFSELVKKDHIKIETDSPYLIISKK